MLQHPLVRLVFIPVVSTAPAQAGIRKGKDMNLDMRRLQIAYAAGGQIAASYRYLTALPKKIVTTRENVILEIGSVR